MTEDIQPKTLNLVLKLQPSEHQKIFALARGADRSATNVIRAMIRYAKDDPGFAASIGAKLS